MPPISRLLIRTGAVYPAAGMTWGVLAAVPGEVLPAAGDAVVVTGDLVLTQEKVNPAVRRPTPCREAGRAELAQQLSEARSGGHGREP